MLKTAPGCSAHAQFVPMGTGVAWQTGDQINHPQLGQDALGWQRQSIAHSGWMPAAWMIRPQAAVS